MYAGSRRHHQKSRLGCMTCKTKKIKCDEVKPSCSHCTSRSIQCTYPQSKSSPSTSNSRITPSTPSDRPGHTTPAVSTPSTNSSLFDPTLLTSPTVFPAGLQPGHHLTQGGQWSLCDLELIHFYAVSTSQTFSTDPARRHVWQTVVPQIAFSHDFLLHGLLALTALHLSRVSPERKDDLLAIASRHHTVALPIFRAAVQDLSSQNHHACVAFSTLLTVYEWAATKYTSNLFFTTAQHPTEPNTIEWVQLLRGSGNIMYCYFEELERGPLAPITHWDSADERRAETDCAESIRFAALEELWKSDSVSVTAEEVEALEEALRWLRIIFTTMTTPNNNNDPAAAALSWPARVPDLYLTMTRECHPAALVLLSHFCLLLNRVDDFWWIHGVSRRLLQELHQTLGSEWEPWIAWPLQDLVLCEFQQQSKSSS